MCAIDRRATTGGPAAIRPLPALALSLLLVACGGGGGGDGDGVAPPDDEPSGGPQDLPGGAACSVAEQNRWVYDSMRDYYLFYDQVPLVDPTTYPSPEALLGEIRFEERDPFSHIRDASDAELEFEEGREFGLGFRWGLDFDERPRVTRVQPDSPFGRAGVERGDVIVSIDEVPALEMLADERYDDYYDTEVFGSREAPGTARWTFLERESGEPFTRTITAAEYAIETLSAWGSFTHPSYDGEIGYVALERFLETSRAEINAVFAELRERAVTDLVLDLRYNGGGRVSVAQLLASAIAGESRAGELLQEYRFNDKYSELNYSLLVQEGALGLELRRLVVLVRGGTASASELVTGGLDALMDVTVIGTWPTAGKPYIQFGNDRCDQRLNAIEAEGFNAAGESVFGGILPDCRTVDDYTRRLGRDPVTDEIEGMLRDGLDFVVFGRCEPFEPVVAKRDATPLRQGFYPGGGAVAERR